MFRIRTAGPWMTLALPALVSIAYTAFSVQSLTLSPVDVPSGSASTGTVTLSATPILATTVALSSSKPGLASVPSSISVGRFQGGNFAITTTSGQTGCATISAREGKTAPKSALLFVHPINPSNAITLSLSPTTVPGGLPATGAVIVTPASAAGQVVQLSSSNPSVTVPASVTLEAREIAAGIANFSIGTSAVSGLGTCAIITATFGTSQERALLKVIPFTQG